MGQASDSNWMAHEIKGDCAVFFHRGGTADEATLRAHYSAIANSGAAKILAVITDNARITTEQRQLAAKLIGDKRVAMLTDSISARAIGLALSVAKNNLRVFGTDDYASAFVHLQTSVEEQAWFRKACKGLLERFRTQDRQAIR